MGAISFSPMFATNWSTHDRVWIRPHRFAAVPLLILALVLASLLLAPLTSAQASAAMAAGPTTSHYETSASAAALYLQGEAAGQAGTQGIVVLDFGRPASNGTSDGTFDFAAQCSLLRRNQYRR